MNSTNTEIERKFLVKVSKLPEQVRTGGERYIQGYLSLQPTVRVRVAGSKAWITIKGPTSGITRSEFEYEVPVDEAIEMLNLCSCKLTKIRRKIRVGNHVWEVDEFQGIHTGLWLAEIELTNEDEVFEKPIWIGPEVSGDARYSNAQLAKTGRKPK